MEQNGYIFNKNNENITLDGEQVWSLKDHNRHRKVRIYDGFGLDSHTNSGGKDANINGTGHLPYLTRIFKGIQVTKIIPQSRN